MTIFFLILSKISIAKCSISFSLKEIFLNILRWFPLHTFILAMKEENKGMSWWYSVFFFVLDFSRRHWSSCGHDKHHPPGCRCCCTKSPHFWSICGKWFFENAYSNMETINICIRNKRKHTRPNKDNRVALNVLKFAIDDIF